MATAVPVREPETVPRPRIPPLQNGDRLTRAEFERRYDATPGLRKAELIEGAVFMASPVRDDQHGRQHLDIGTWLGYYGAFTPGVVGGCDSTVRLDLDNEPQPDAHLRIESTRGGQAKIEEGYVTGAPELAAEVAASSVSYDLHLKLNAYRRSGVLEYIVWRVLDGQIDWFALREGRYDQLPPNAAGIVKSQALPGLWLDTAAMLRGDMATVIQVLQQGIQSPEHADFVARLANATAGPGKQA